jgi:hypothetical protein
VVIRRPVESWSQGIVESGVVLVPGQGDDADGQVSLYAVLDGNVAALLVPTGDSWKLTEVPESIRPILFGRHPDRKLLFPSDPTEGAWRKRPVLPLQQVDPNKINAVYIGSDLADLLRKRGQIAKGDWDMDIGTEELTSTQPYRDLEARLGGQPVGTFQSLRRKLKSSDDTVIDHLCEGIRRDGIRPQGEDGVPSEHDIQVAIGRSGRYILLSGLKRVAIARLLGMDRIPVNVVARHPKWENFRARVLRFAGNHRGRVYQRIGHPDLNDIQAHHDEDRLPLIKKALNGYDPKGKRLMDVGAHWGQMSAAMEDIGFAVTAVEANPDSAKFIVALRDAMEYKFGMWEGSVFEYPGIAEQNVILGLNIFHHFLKSQETYDGLVSMLQRSKADMIIFAAHVHDRGPDFDNAYRNYAPDEFARFVSENSRLPNVEKLGYSHDGRTLFKISR